MVINHSRDSEYHSQRNNRVIPHASCNSTSMIMALKQAGVVLPFPDNQQPEDYLTCILLSETCIRQIEKLAPWALDRQTGKPLFPPYEIHVLMEWAVNYLLNKQIVSFSTKTPIEKIIRQIDNHGGAVLSGRFPVNRTHYNHMVSLAGYMTHQGSITALLIDDPYGDYKTAYRSPRGNNIPVPYKEALKIFKPTGNDYSKWAYLVGCKYF